MDRTSILVLAVCFLILLLWYPLVNKFYPTQPAPARTNVVSAITNQPSPAAAADTPSARANLPAPTAATPIVTASNLPEQLLVLTNSSGRYTFSSHGGGLKSVELTGYPETVSRKKTLAPQKYARLNADAPVPVLALRGDASLEGDGVFELAPLPGGVRASKVLSNGLRVVKDFTLSATNFLLHAKVRIENTAAQPAPLPAQSWIVGTATPMSPDDTEQLVGFYWFDGQRDDHKDDAYFANRTLGCFPGTPRPQYVAGASNVVWAAVHNQFFALAVIPPSNAPALQVIVDKVKLPPPTAKELAEHPKANKEPFGFVAGLVYPPVQLAAGQALEKDFHIFAGPREYRTLARLGAHFRNELDLVMGYSGFFGFFAKMLLLSMNALHGLGLGYALAIIAITVIIKLLFWPLTQASTRSMKRMAELQPQMKALQDKYKDDPAKMQRKLMEFMKENRVNPMGGCLPMLLQIPVFFGFYQMIQSAIELRGERFLWAYDLSKPDTVFVIPGVDFPVNPLPLLMGVTMLWQSKLTPPSPGMDPMQQKLMRYMPLMFLFILYNFSAGLTLYWTVQNLLTIAQMKLTKSQQPAAPAGAKPAEVRPARRKS